MNTDLYKEHIRTVRKYWTTALKDAELDAAVVSAGANPFFFADDQNPPFHANPHFLRWVPESHCEHSALVVDADENVTIFWYEPKDFWYLPSPPPGWILDTFEVEVHDDKDQLLRSVTERVRSLRRVTHVGPDWPELSTAPSMQSATQSFLDQLDYHRAYKTAYEVQCIDEATRVAVAGHRAAEQVFFDGGSEYDIHIAYLAASRQMHHELPYPSIVALNEHAGTLHYQYYDRAGPEETHSFLIDAGGRSQCYHSDITRTYSAGTVRIFGELTDAVDMQQQSLIEEISSGVEFDQLHSRMHQRVADLLTEFGILKCSPETAFEQRLTEPFFPHGLGHLLGLQTHDVGGQLRANGNWERFVSDLYPSLRFTRIIEPGMVFTVEPGIYFIPMLLDSLSESSEVNWDLVQQLIPCGGIRIEDNVLVQPNGVRNITREAFAEAQSS